MSIHHESLRIKDASQVDSVFSEVEVVYSWCPDVSVLESHVSLNDVSNKLDLHPPVSKIIGNMHIVQNVQFVDET